MAYIKEELEKMLKEHTKNEAKLTEVKLSKEEYQERLGYAGTVYQDTEEEIIENMQLAGQGYDSIHSNTNKISDKVCSTALSYHNQENHVNKENRIFLEKKIEECKSEENRLNKIIVRVNNMINQLPSEEKFVIKTYYMEKSKWDYVEKEYFNEFEKYKCIKQLQKYRDSAIDSMLEIINTIS